LALFHMPHTSFKKAANFSGFFYTFLQVVIFGLS